MSKRPRTVPQDRVVFPPFSRVYVRCGLLSVHQLRKSLARFGDIAGVSKHEGDHRKEGGYAFVQFRLASSAARCCEASLEHIDDEPVTIEMAEARSKKRSNRRQRVGGSGSAQPSIVIPPPASTQLLPSIQLPCGTSPPPQRSWLLVTSCTSSTGSAGLQLLLSPSSSLPFSSSTSTSCRRAWTQHRRRESVRLPLPSLRQA